MRKILITGGTGFVGSNFVYKFLKLGDEVNLIVRPESNFWRIESIKSKIKLHYINLTSAEAVERFITDLHPQIIFHFAAYGAHQEWQQDVKTIINTNLLGTINLVNASSKIDLECFINTGSAMEYGAKDKSMKEDNLLEPNNLYGITKASATMYCQFMSRKMNLPLVTMRLFSPYGCFGEKRALIPTIIKAYLINSELNLSSPSLSRDFIFMEDVIESYLKVIEKINSVKGNTFNIGSGIQHSIADVVGMVKKMTNSNLEPNYKTTEKIQHEPQNWAADISKAEKLLNWKPKFSLEEGLKKNIEWFSQNLALYN